MVLPEYRKSLKSWWGPLHVHNSIVCVFISEPKGTQILDQEGGPIEHLVYLQYQRQALDVTGEYTKLSVDHNNHTACK